MFHLHENYRQEHEIPKEINQHQIYIYIYVYTYIYIYIHIWWFPKIGVPPDKSSIYRCFFHWKPSSYWGSTSGHFMTGHPFRIDDLGVPPFEETPIYM